MKNDPRGLLASALLGHKPQDGTPEPSPLARALADHSVRHKAYVDEVLRRWEKARRSVKRTFGRGDTA